jgi:hypothetical protein
MAWTRDHSLDALLYLDGQTFFVDSAGVYWVKFEVKSVVVTETKPYGLSYSLTLHGANNQRLVGFDNAHPIQQGRGPGAKRPIAQDHKHRFRTIKPYEYKDAATLLTDFWAEVDSVLKEKGVST